jgi:pimeloyl-ACP methyl ester carboxylesterase
MAPAVDIVNPNHKTGCLVYRTGWTGDMTTFGLVHGGYHGGWCWDLVVSELADMGISAIAMDLPIDDVNAAASEYADVVVHSLSSVADEVVLVGHSMGGLVIPIVASRREVSKMIFLAAEPPTPGRSMAEYLTAHPDVLRAPPDSVPQGDSLSPPPSLDVATEIFFHDCTPGMAAWATEQLRPQSAAILYEPCPLEAWPDTPSSAIVCTDDRAVNPVGYRKMVREVLDLEPEAIRSSHSPFLSRAKELTSLLISLSR